MGRCNADRWRANWQHLFDHNELVTNERQILRIDITPERDGGLAVRWCGRVCKVDARCHDGWKMTMHTGVLVYD